jgi:hypothetical protein
VSDDPFSVLVETDSHGRNADENSCSEASDTASNPGLKASARMSSRQVERGRMSSRQVEAPLGAQRHMRASKQEVRTASSKGGPAGRETKIGESRRPSKEGEAWRISKEEEARRATKEGKTRRVSGDSDEKEARMAALAAKFAAKEARRARPTVDGSRTERRPPRPDSGKRPESDGVRTARASSGERGLVNPAPFSDRGKPPLGVPTRASVGGQKPVESFSRVAGLATGNLSAKPTIGMRDPKAYVTKGRAKSDPEMFRPVDASFPSKTSKAQASHLVDDVAPGGWDYTFNPFHRGSARASDPGGRTGRKVTDNNRWPVSAHLRQLALRRAEREEP